MISGQTLAPWRFRLFLMKTLARLFLVKYVSLAFARS